MWPERNSDQGSSFEAYSASACVRTWKITAFRFSSTHLSRIAIISRCCSSPGKPGREGQSIFSTVATHTPRNSRATGGGAAPSPRF